MMTDADLQLARRFKAALRDAGIMPLCFTVFGSRARGDAESDADLDVLLEFEQRDRELKSRIRDTAWRIEFETGILIQPVVVTREEMEHSPFRSSLLMLAVRQDGVQV